MPRTRRAGRKSKKRGRRNIIKLASGVGSRGVRDVGRGVGRVVGYVPIVGKPGRKVINVGSRMAGDAVTLVGSKSRTHRRKRSRSRRRKRSRSRRRKSRTHRRKRSRSRRRKRSRRR